MLDRVDRMLVAVSSRARASETFARLLGAEPAREGERLYLPGTTTAGFPRSRHGMLLGISRETVAWEWSGRPERVRPPLD